VTYGRPAHATTTCLVFDRFPHPFRHGTNGTRRAGV